MKPSPKWHLIAKSPRNWARKWTFHLHCKKILRTILTQINWHRTSAQAFNTASFSIVVAASLYNCKDESFAWPTFESLVTSSCWIRRTSFKSRAMPLAIHALQTWKKETTKNFDWKNPKQSCCSTRTGNWLISKRSSVGDAYFVQPCLTKVKHF